MYKWLKIIETDYEKNWDKVSEKKIKQSKTEQNKSKQK